MATSNVTGQHHPAGNLMPILRAAKSSEELALLRTVVSDLSDATALSVYNDWLEEQGDPRGPYLRKFMQAFAGNKTLPKMPARFSQAWADVLALPVRRRLRHGIEPTDPQWREF